MGDAWEGKSAAEILMDFNALISNVFSAVDSLKPDTVHVSWRTAKIFNRAIMSKRQFRRWRGKMRGWYWK